MPNKDKTMKSKDNTECFVLYSGTFKRIKEKYGDIPFWVVRVSYDVEKAWVGKAPLPFYGIKEADELVAEMAIDNGLMFKADVNSKEN